jgi:hypothetical protein
MGLRALALLVVGIPLLAACNDSRNYSSNLADEKYDLAAMSLTEGDLPKGFTRQALGDPDEASLHQFDNAAWSERVFDTEDPEGKKAQLDAQGRITNYVNLFSPPNPGPVLNVTTISTLYTDEKAAAEATSRFACGLPIKDTQPLDEFFVPTVADQSTGFFVVEENDGGVNFVDTTVCFRTGRIVHALQQTSLPGVEDIALAVRLAQRWLGHVNDAFDGKAPPPDPTPENG